MNFIKKIVDKKIDEGVHLQFQKFSRGEFRDRAIISAKQSAGKFTVNTGPEFANELVRDVASVVGKNKVKVTGIIVSTLNLKEAPEFHDLLANAEVSQFQGVKKFSVNDDLTGEEIINFLNKNPKVFFALSFSTPDSATILKIKPKMPKSGKPKAAKEGDDEEIKGDFCKLITTDKKLGESFVFENPNFKTAAIKHTFFINDIVIPQSLKNEKDFAKVREGALRKGKIVREGEIDDVKFKKDIEFEA